MTKNRFGKPMHWQRLSRTFTIIVNVEGLVLNLTRFPLILLILVCALMAYSFAALISYSIANDNLQKTNVNENIPGSSSDIFARRYHTQHPPCSGLPEVGGPLSYKMHGP